MDMTVYHHHTDTGRAELYVVYDDGEGGIVVITDDGEVDDVDSVPDTAQPMVPGRNP